MTIIANGMERLPSEKQLQFISGLGYEGDVSEIKNMQEASDLIQALLEKKEALEREEEEKMEKELTQGLDSNAIAFSGVRKKRAESMTYEEAERVLTLSGEAQEFMDAFMRYRKQVVANDFYGHIRSRLRREKPITPKIILTLVIRGYERLLKNPVVCGENRETLESDYKAIMEHYDKGLAFAHYAIEREEVPHDLRSEWKSKKAEYWRKQYIASHYEAKGKKPERVRGYVVAKNLDKEASKYE